MILRQDVVATALRSSIQFTNRIKGHSASIPDHAAVRDAIMRRKPEVARVAMRRIIGDVLLLIDTTDNNPKSVSARKRKGKATG